MDIQSVSSQSIPISLPVREAAPRVATEATSTSTQAAVQQATPQQLENAVGQVNQAMQQANVGVQFSIDSSTKRPVVSMVDSNSGKLIRQYPNEEVLAISQSIDQFLKRQGLLLQKTA